MRRALFHKASLRRSRRSRPSPLLRLASRKNASPRYQSGAFNRLAEGDLVGALHDGDAVGNERVAQDVARLWDGGEGDELARVGHVLWHLGCGVRLRLGVGCGRWGVYEAGIFVFAAADYLCWWWGGGADE